MSDLFENPMGLCGFEFVEFTAPEEGILEPVFLSMGFTKVATHRSKNVHLWRQGGINLLANYEPNTLLAIQKRTSSSETRPIASGNGGFHFGIKCTKR